MSTARVLAIVLAVQLVVVAISWWPGDPAASRPRAVFDHPRDSIEEISIAVRPQDGAEADPVVLARSGDGWVVRSAAQYPADPARIDELLDAILALRAGAPIATRSASHEALSVSDENYGRRLRVVADGEASEWLLGAATSRSINLRRVGEDDVYQARGASEWAFHDKASSYYDARYLAADPDSFAAVAVHNTHGDLRFEKQDESWTLAGLGEGESSDPEKISDFLREIASLRMAAPVGREIDASYGLGAGARVDWTIAAEDQSVAGGYAVGAVETDVDAEAFVKAVDSPFIVRVSRRGVQRLRDAERSQFLASPADSD